MVQTCYHRFDETFSGLGSNSSPSVNYHNLNENHSSHCSVSQCCGNFSQSSTTSSSVVRVPQASLPTQHWYPDSGATNHVTLTMATLTDVSPYTGTSQVSMGNGESVSIDNVGSSNILAGSRLLHLRDVLHVPTVCKNLIFVGQFAKDNNVYFEFHPILCFVKDIQTGKTLLVGYMHDGLYRFDFSRADLYRFGSGHRLDSPLLYNVQAHSSLDL